MAINSKRPGRIFRGNGLPGATLGGVNPTNIQNDDVYLDYTNKTSYIRENKVWVLDSENPFFKPKGDPGTPGASSTWGISPDDYGAVHSTQTFAGGGFNQSYINTNYPGIGATTTDTIDWAAWQMAVDTGRSTGKVISAFGSYYTNRTIKIRKYLAKNFRVLANATIHPTTVGIDAIKYGNSFNGTSATNISITTGNKTITTNVGLTSDLGTALTVGQLITLFNGTNRYISGTMVSYNAGSGSLVVNINTIFGWVGDGSESHNSWQVYFADYDTPTPGVLYYGSSVEGDSITMGNHKAILDGIRVSNNQVPGNARCGIGINWRCSYGLKILNGQFAGCTTPLVVRFALRTVIDNCFADGCINGFTASWGDWYSATASNSQSNHTTMQNCRFYTYDDGVDGFRFEGVSGGVIKDCIIEGTQLINGIYFNANGSPNVLDFTVENVHFECNHDAAAGQASASSMTVGTGSKSMTIGTGLDWYVGQPVRIYMAGTGGGTYMGGTITSYNSGSGALVVNVTETQGSGSSSSWVINLRVGARNAFIYVRMNAGVVTLNKTYGQYACILLDMEGTSSTIAVKAMNIPYWVPAAGKLFRARGAVNLLIDWTDNLYADAADIATKFETTTGTMAAPAGTSSTLVTFGTMGNGSGNKHSHIPIFR